MRRRRQDMQTSPTPAQTGECSKQFAALNVSHAPAMQCLKDQDVVLGGMANHFGKINFCPFSFGALPESCVSPEAGLAVIIRINFGIGQKIILLTQALNSRAILRRISHYLALSSIQK